MNNETDVLEFDFPDYEEPYSPLPDVKVAPFDKEDSYRRNRSIVDEFYAEKLKEEKLYIKKRRKTERKKRRTTRASERSKKRSVKKSLAVIALLFAVGASALFAFNRSAKPAERPQTILSENSYIPPEPLPEPFEQPDNAEYGTAYSTDTLSFMFTLFVPNEFSGGDIAVDVQVRNLTEEKYWLMVNSFYLTDGEKTAYCNKMYYPNYVGLPVLYTLEDENYREYTDPIALGFNSSGECRFTLIFDPDKFDIKDQTFSIGYDSELISAAIVENTSDSFEIPLSAYPVNNSNYN
ncbi:MAG: hypothetical protein K2N60_00850 [Oscillospiraceae bacterium]|nr:hypothetical protein [Oscillospiraceae bacterium]